MAISTANAVWNGTLKEGNGNMKLGSGAFDGAYTYASRFEGAGGANPDELIGAASAGCFSMFLSALLTKAGTPPERIETNAKVHLGEGPAITKIELSCDAVVPGIDDAQFQETARTAKANCPVSKALAGTEIVLEARLGS